MAPDRIPVILWFRRDLRLADNPSLCAAAGTGRPIIPVYIFENKKKWAPGGASRWWLYHSLRSLEHALNGKKLKLIFRRGSPREALKKLVQETRANAVFWNRVYDPGALEEELELKTMLEKEGCESRRFAGSLIFEPSAIKTGQGKPYQVFTPYWVACKAAPPPKSCLNIPVDLNVPDQWPTSENMEAYQLLPQHHWAGAFSSLWEPGEKGAQKKLKIFLNAPVNHYSESRNIPGESGSSRLSPHLHFGEITPRQIWHALGNKSDVFLKEIGWREFAHHLLFHFPHTAEQPLRTPYKKFPWRVHNEHLKAWQKGVTGYPIVDAGMRELWRTGWMHNRVRMITASFLVKDLLISWKDGAQWFWDTLVDADLANNTMGWQWSAGCGADAAPYFRVFNPVTQGERYDSEGIYVRKWVPELKNLPSRWVHCPWLAPKNELLKAGIELGTTYPRPIVDHAEARQKALLAYKKIRA